PGATGPQALDPLARQRLVREGQAKAPERRPPETDHREPPISVLAREIRAAAKIALGSPRHLVRVVQRAHGGDRLDLAVVDAPDQARLGVGQLRGGRAALSDSSAPAASARPARSSADRTVAAPLAEPSTGRNARTRSPACCAAICATARSASVKGSFGRMSSRLASTSSSASED